MAWATPPTFSYNYPASVDDMNIIRNDLLYLYGQMFATASASQETEVKADHPYTSSAEDRQVVYVGWIEHHEDNLWYRIRLKSENAPSHSANLYIEYFQDPYGSGDSMGEHPETQTVGTTYVDFTNSDAAVDISGWGLTYGNMYKVTVEIGANDNNNVDIIAETNFIYEMA